MYDHIIDINNLSKIYKLYDQPIDRLKESLSISGKSYHHTHYALKDVSFKVNKGDNFGIIGTNGAGKSTLLKIITGIITPTDGSVTVSGKISALLELGAGFNPEYTGMENIFLNGTMMGYKKEEMDIKVPDIVDFAGIGEFIHQPVKTYSSGMFARLAFAVAINTEPDILIVDEALSVGDTRFQIKCMNKMKEMIEGGTTVLFVSHDTNTIKRFCTKAIWLNNGTIQDIGEVNKVCDAYLDFLKLGGHQDKEPELVKIDSYEDALPPFVPGNNIAEIIDFKTYNKNNINISEMKLDDYIRVEVIYDVYDTSIQNPVLGVSIRGMDDDYVCGLNTMIDQVEIPWEYGRNKFQLEYPMGIMAIGGKYYFDVALFDETATVPIQYKSMVRNFTITSKYEGEGRYIIPHSWNNC